MGGVRVVVAEVHAVDPVRLGFLYPGHAAESDYPDLVRCLPAPSGAEVVHTSVGQLGDLHTVEAMHAMGEDQRLADGAAVLRSRGVAAAMWACTSGSFVYGWDGAEDQVATLRAHAGVPASSTSFAFVHAARELGIRRVAVAATYPEPLARRFVDFLGGGGIEVTGLAPASIMTATEAGRLTDDETVAMIAAGDRPDADAVLVPDTALRTASVLPRLAREVGKPVLTANQVTVWEAARLAGLGPDLGLGQFLAGDLVSSGADRYGAGR
jgi:maleate cis-trans isomerase